MEDEQPKANRWHNHDDRYVKKTGESAWHGYNKTTEGEFFGTGARATGEDGLAIGPGASASGIRSIAIGPDIAVPFDDRTVIAGNVFQIERSSGTGPTVIRINRLDGTEVELGVDNDNTLTIDEVDVAQEVADALAAALLAIAAEQAAQDAEIASKATPADVQTLEDSLTLVLNTKRNEADNIPQSDVTGLPTDLANILAGLADKVEQGDIDLLETTLQGTIDDLSDRDRVNVLTSSDGTTSTSASTVGNMTFSVAANTSYSLHAVIDAVAPTGHISGTSAFGVRFGVTFPFGSTVNGAISGFTDASTPKFSSITTSGLDTTVFMTDEIFQRTTIDATIDVAGSSGSITVVFAVTESGDIMTAGRSSKAELRRLDS